MTAAEDMPAASRRIPPRLVAIVFAAFFAALAAGYYFLLQPAYVPAFTGLRPADAAALTAQLDVKAMPYRLADGGTTVLVPEQQADAARVAVAGSEVPMHGGVGLELFNKSDMGLTDFAQRINYQRATQGELERTIGMIDGVERARVHLAIPERSIFRAERTAPKAAVELVTRPGALIDAGRITGIQRLVANAVPDLLATDVVIIDATGRELSTAADAAASAADPSGEEQQGLRHYYRARVRAALEAALPAMPIEPAVMPLAAPAGDVRAAAAAGAPGARSFGLRVTLTTAVPLTSDDRANAQAAVVKAIGFDAALGDEIAFAVGLSRRPSGSASFGTMPTPVAPASAADQPVSSSPSIGWPLPVVGILLLAAMGLIWHRRTAATGGLTAEERRSLVDRLRQAVAVSGDRHVA